MEIILMIVAGLILLPYVAGPLLLWISGSRISPTQLEVADPSRQLAQRAEAHFWKTTHFFGSQGFAQLGERVRESNRSGLSGYKQVWRHETTGEVALVGAFLKEGDAEFCNTFVAFIHDRNNGAKVMTSNFDAGARTQLDHPSTSKLALPVQDLAALRVMHQAHVAACEGVRPLRIRDGLTLCRQLDDATRTIVLSRKRFRVEGDTLRITLWGALVGIWINLAPFKWKYERQQRDLLARVMAAGAAAASSANGKAA